MATLLVDDEASSAAASSPTSTCALEGFERPRKLRRQGSIMSLLRTVTNSASGHSNGGSVWAPASPPPSERSPDRHRLFRKMSLPFFRSQFGGAVTVIHRVKRKSRPSIRSIERATDKLLPASAPAILSISTSNSTTTNSSGKSSGPTHGTGTTVATSFESKLSRKDNDPVEQRPASIVYHHKELEKVPTTVDPGLTTIQEKAIDPPPSPTILTVEKAAAAKIYLETYFNEKINKPSPRSLRRRYLESELYHGFDLSPAEKDMRRALFCQQETNHLRKSRVLAARSLGAMKCERGELADDYEVLKILGKGSFGVVRLVRKKPRKDGYQRDSQVYAMKVIRKSAMLKTSQEGHLRAERDFLVASEGSRIVPLIASFQDAGNLYLVMEYMPGGDFLGLLIRENILSEPVAKFYIAEMILCIEEAHSLRCIHRDIKPDNFLISATGHLKISDFGLAFDGHWSHDTSYYHTQRYSLLHKLGLSVEGDAADRAEGLQGTMKWAQGVTQAMQKHARQPPPTNSSSTTSTPRDEPLLNWRNRCGNRSAARSCSLGVILYECLYGHTPFLSEEGGRQQTKRNIVNHEQTFAFPPRPVVSRRCMDLIASLVCARENRLSSKRYHLRNTGPEHHHPAISGATRGRQRSRDGRGRSVYPHDAEDIKAHKWFRDIPWEQLHLITPPFVPHIASIEDTHYFDEEEPISDWSDTCSDDDDDTESESSDVAPALEANPLAMRCAGGETPNMGPFTPPAPVPPRTGTVHGAAPVIRRSPQKTAAMQTQLVAFPRHVRGILAQFVASPYDSTRLKRMDREINALVANGASTSTPSAQAPLAVVQFQEVMLADQMKAFVRTFGRRERKRPRDRLLRDRKTKAAVLKVRKQTAFLGYTFRRVTDTDNTAISTFDGVERMPPPRVYVHGGMESIAEYRELEVGGPAATAAAMRMTRGCRGVGARGVGVRFGDAVHTTVYRPLNQEPREVNMAR
ncbi:kinase-like domain-containing protein [Xylaria grammica]|nr:kinase-like domain-containing protein [Xylaria grammica]